MLPPPRASIIGTAPRASAISEYAEMSIVMRKPSRLVLTKGAWKLVAGRECRAMDDEVEPAKFLLDFREDGVDLRIRSHVARQHQRRLRRDPVESSWTCSSKRP